MLFSERSRHPFYLLLCLFFLYASLNNALIISHPSAIKRTSRNIVQPLQAKSTKKAKKTGVTTAGVRGFGGGSSSSSSLSNTNQIVFDRSKDALAFYDFLERNGAGDNLKRTALAYFPLPGGTQQLRGVVASRDMKKGDVVIRIPYEIAINLGLEGGDPTLPALDLLKQYCDSMSSISEQNGLDRRPYYRMLPEFMGPDSLGSTDFFSDDALEALQSPIVFEETMRRRERTKKAFENLEEPIPIWCNGEKISEQHLRWAVWLITSRVLTVEGHPDENRSSRLMIPYLDMCNHDRSSPHLLSGRAIPGGELKVVAGAPIQAGEQINICYGGGVAGNDRFLQDYGFLDGDEAYRIVAQQLLGKKRILEGANAGRTISIADREAAIATLRSTTLSEDRECLAGMQDSSMKLAMQYRLGVKTALSKEMKIE